MHALVSVYTLVSFDIQLAYTHCEFCTHSLISHVTSSYKSYVFTHNLFARSPKRFMEGFNPEVLSSLEQRIFKDKLACYKGTAQIGFDHLYFPQPCRQFDRKIVDQLKKDFDGEGYKRDKTENRISAIIKNSLLQEALLVLTISSELFHTTSRDQQLKLQFSGDKKLECLHGQHRILAAREFLSGANRT